MFKILLLCFYTLCCLVTSAQITDSTKRPPDSAFHVVFATLGSLNKTDAGDAYLLNNNLNVEYNKRHFTVNTFSNWIYGQQNNTLTNNDFTATVNVDYLKNL